jgi:hypothetical protein
MVEEEVVCGEALEEGDEGGCGAEGARVCENVRLLTDARSIGRVKVNYMP